MAEIINLFPTTGPTNKADEGKNNSPDIGYKSNKTQDQERAKVYNKVCSVLDYKAINDVSIPFLMSTLFQILDSVDQKRKKNKIRSSDVHCNHLGEDYELIENNSPLRPIFSALEKIKPSSQILLMIANNEAFRKGIIKIMNGGYGRRIFDELQLILNKNKGIDISMFLQFIFLIDHSYPDVLLNPLTESMRERLLASNRRDGKGYSSLQLRRIEKLIGGIIS